MCALVVHITMRIMNVVQRNVLYCSTVLSRGFDFASLVALFYYALHLLAILISMNLHLLSRAWSTCALTLSKRNSC